MDNHFRNQLVNLHIPFIASGHDYVQFIFNDKLYYYKSIALTGKLVYQIHAILTELVKNPFTHETFESMYPMSNRINDYVTYNQNPSVEVERYPLVGEHDNYGWHYPLYLDINITTNFVTFSCLNLCGEFCDLPHKHPWNDNLAINLTHKEAIIILSEMYAHYNRDEMGDCIYAHPQSFSNNATLRTFQDNYLLYLKKSLDDGEITLFDLLRWGCYNSLTANIVHFGKEKFVINCIEALLDNDIKLSPAVKSLVHYFLVQFLESLPYQNFTKLVSESLKEMLRKIQPYIKELENELKIEY